MRRTYLAIGLIGFVLAFPGVSRAEFKDKATGLNFPDTIGDMKQDSVTDFEKEHPGLGLGNGIGYSDTRNPKIYADVFVYDLNEKQIPEGSSNPVVAKQMSDAERDLFIQEQRGVYSKVKKIKTASRLLGASSGAPIALESEFSFTQNNIAKHSFIFLTGYRKNFVKIRFTFPEQDEATGEQAMQAFLTQIGKMLKS